MTARSRLILASASLVTSVAVGAHAGNDDGVLLGEQAMITGGAVTAIVSDGASAWYNPAGLGLSSCRAVHRCPRASPCSGRVARRDLAVPATGQGVGRHHVRFPLAHDGASLSPRSASNRCPSTCR